VSSCSRIRSMVSKMTSTSTGARSVRRGRPTFAGAVPNTGPSRDAGCGAL
jgi:hypothetical protein